MQQIIQIQWQEPNNGAESNRNDTDCQQKKPMEQTR